MEKTSILVDLDKVREHFDAHLTQEQAHTFIMKIIDLFMQYANHVVEQLNIISDESLSTNSNEKFKASIYAIRTVHYVRNLYSIMEPYLDDTDDLNALRELYDYIDDRLVELDTYTRKIVNRMSMDDEN